MWSKGNSTLGVVFNLPSATVIASGNSPLTATVLSELAITLINGGPGGGVLIGVPAATWNGQRPVFMNRSGGMVTLYLYSGDQFENQGANVGYSLNDGQNVTLSVVQSGAVLISG